MVLSSGGAGPSGRILDIRGWTVELGVESKVEREIYSPDSVEMVRVRIPWTFGPLRGGRMRSSERWV